MIVAVQNFFILLLFFLPSWEDLYVVKDAAMVALSVELRRDERKKEGEEWEGRRMMMMMERRGQERGGRGGWWLG